MDSNTMKRYPALASDLRLLTAASRLKQFTVFELAEHAGVGLELTRSFLRRNKDFERSALESCECRGRPKKIWRLRPERSLHVAAYVADVSRVIGWTPAPPDESPKTWELLRAALERLNSSSLTDERPRILRRAETYLASAEMELRDRIALSLPVAPQEQQVVVEAASTISLLRRIASIPATLLIVLRPSPALCTAFGKGLGDWTRRMELSALDKGALPLDQQIAREQLRIHGASGILDMALHIAARDPDLDAVLAPAVSMLHYKLGWDGAIDSAFARDMKDRLSSSKVADSPRLLTALAATMAAFDIDEALEPLTDLILSKQCTRNMPSKWRTVCRCAFARFARPGKPLRNISDAGAACHFLLARADDPAELPILATAALGAPHADASSLLHQIGRVMAAPYPDLGSIARNLGMALARDDFQPLQQQIDNLIEHDEYGLLLLGKLRAPKYGALRLIDSDQTTQHPFLVQPRPLVAKSLGIAVRTVPLRIRESAGDRLAQMISHDAWSDEPSGLLGALLTQRTGLTLQAQAL
jgi:hypothetical protein